MLIFLIFPSIYVFAIKSGKQESVYMQTFFAYFAQLLLFISMLDARNCFESHIFSTDSALCAVCVLCVTSTIHPFKKNLSICLCMYCWEREVVFHCCTIWASSRDVICDFRPWFQLSSILSTAFCVYVIGRIWKKLAKHKQRRDASRV